MKLNKISAAFLSMGIFSPIASATLIDDLISGSKHEIEGFVYHFLDEAENYTVDTQRTHALLAIETKTGAKLNDQSYLNVELLTYGHTMEDTYNGFDPLDRDHEYAAVVTPKALNVVFEGDDYDVTAGLGTVDFGYGEIHNAVSNFRRFNTVHPGHSYELGVVMARYRKYIQDDTFSYTMMPVDLVSPHPTGANRWKGSGSLGYPALPTWLPSGFQNRNVSDFVDSQAMDVSVDNIRHLFLYEATRPGYDFYGFAALGPSPFAIIRLENLTTVNYHNPKALQVGGGITKVFGPHKVYTDIMYQETESAEDENFLRGSVGGVFKESEISKKYGINEVTLTAEYAYDLKTQDAAINISIPTTTVFSSAKSRAGRNTLIGRLEFDIDSKWNANVGTVYNFYGDDRADTLGLEYKANDSLSYYLNGTWFSGDDLTWTSLNSWTGTNVSPFGYLDNNDVIEIGFKLSL